MLTVNLNRCVQQATREGRPYVEFLEEVVDLVHKVQTAYDANLRDLQAKGMLPLFDAGYINLSRHYLTVGVNGLVEAAESHGLTISDNPDYEAFVQEVLGLVERYKPEIPHARPDVQLRDDSCRERRRETRPVGQGGRILRAA